MDESDCLKFAERPVRLLLKASGLFTSEIPDEAVPITLFGIDIKLILVQKGYISPIKMIKVPGVYAKISILITACTVMLEEIKKECASLKPYHFSADLNNMTISLFKDIKTHSDYRIGFEIIQK